MKSKILTLAIGLFLSVCARGQDRIFKIDSTEISCIVKEISSTEIKYIKNDINPGVLFSVDVREVARIVFSDGKVFMLDHQKALTETTEKNTSELFRLQRKNAIKIDFLGLPFNVLAFTYERCTRPGGSVELTLGAIGKGIAKAADFKPEGVVMKGGYKFIRSPDYYLRGMRYAHILRGRYVKLELDYALYSFDSYDYGLSYNPEAKTRKVLSKWGLQVVFGSQYVFNDIFLIGEYAGIGIGSVNRDEPDFPYGFAAGNSVLPISASCGVRIGFLIR